MNVLSQLYESLIYPVVLTWYISLTAILYAFIRAKHDSYINQGKWKTWAFIEGAFWAITVALLAGESLLEYIIYPLLFGLWFWLWFDPFCGLMRKRGFFYIGSTDKADYKARKIFINGRNYFIFKLVWLIIIQGIYLSILEM